MTQTEFDARVNADIAALIAIHSAPAVVRERCAFCGGHGRVAIVIPDAAWWPTRRCSVCNGLGAVVVEV